MGGGVIVSQRQHIQKPDTGQGSAGCQRGSFGDGFTVHSEIDLVGVLLAVVGQGMAAIFIL